MLNFLAGGGRGKVGGGATILDFSCTGKSGRNAKLGLRRVGVCCCTMGECGGVTVVEEQMDGEFIPVEAADPADTTSLVIGYDGGAAFDVAELDDGPLAGDSCDRGSSGKSRIGTESR